MTLLQRVFSACLDTSEAAQSDEEDSGKNSRHGGTEWLLTPGGKPHPYKGGTQVNSYLVYDW